MGVVFRLTGLTDTVEGFAADCEANWLRETEPETWGKVRHYLGLSGFLDPTPRSGGWWTPRPRRWATCRSTTSRFTWAAPRRLEVDRRAHRARLAARAWSPRLARSERSRLLRRATPDCRPGCRSWRRPRDKACEVLGSGAVTPDVLGLSYGTAATANVTSARYVEPIPLIPPFPAAIPGRLDPRDAGLSRVLDGGVVQARVRGPRGGRVAAERGVAPETLFERARLRPFRRAPTASCSSRTGHRGSASPGRRRAARSSGSTRSTPVPTCIARCSRASPMPSAKARSAPPSGPACR